MLNKEAQGGSPGIRLEHLCCLTVTSVPASVLGCSDYSSPVPYPKTIRTVTQRVAYSLAKAN